MGKIFTIINNKGGTAKTTTVHNLGMALVRRKKKVLFVDLDGQANLTSALGITDIKAHAGHMMMKSKETSQVLVTRDGYVAIPADDKVIDFEHQVNNEPGREYLLRECLEDLKSKFDYILIDCAPNMGIFSINSLVAADYFIVPMQAENFAFLGLDKILEVSDKVKKRLNPGLSLAGILIVRQSQKTKFSQAVISNISQNERIREKLFQTVIRQDISLMESAAFGQSVFEYAPGSRGAEDYGQLAKEIIKKFS